jgi:hypothetical protein
MVSDVALVSAAKITPSLNFTPTIVVPVFLYLIGGTTF